MYYREMCIRRTKFRLSRESISIDLMRADTSIGKRAVLKITHVNSDHIVADVVWVSATSSFANLVSNS